jgi:hypothetical protein
MTRVGDMPLRPRTPLEALAIVLCPAAAFGPGAGRALAPVKREILRRYWAARPRT